MKFRSLNSAIQSVTNPQSEPELTQEEYIDILESVLESIAEELECSVEELIISESNMKELDTERQLKQWRKDHVKKFYADKAAKKASRSPAEVEKDAKSDAYVASHEKKTGRRIGRID